MAAGEVRFSLLFCSLCGFIFLSTTHISGANISKESVKQWADNIGKSAFIFANETTGAPALQKAYENLNLEVKTVDWKDVLGETKRGMDAFFEQKANALRKLVNKAEEAYCKHKYDKKLKLGGIDYPNSKSLDEYLNDTGLSLEESSIFKTEVSFNWSSVHVPTDVYDGAPAIVNGISWSRHLDEVFIENWKNSGRHSLAWQYFGSDKGFLRTYPGSAWARPDDKQVDLYDARRRPWYIHGATSPKDAIILIDASGSMHGVPMRIAKLAAKAMIDTLDENDFFNVVYFNTKAVVLCCPESRKLLQANKKNKVYAKGKLEDIEDTEVANWHVGMEEALTLLEQARNCSMCQKAIMVFSDGGTTTLTDTFEERNSDKKVRVFTHPVGPPAESTVAMYRMSCNNRGYFTRIQSIGAVREVSENYVRVMTRPLAMSRKDNTTLDTTVWTSVYLDAMGLGMMVTATMPAFYRAADATKCVGNKGDKSHLLGIMGIDIPLSYLDKYVLQPLIGPNGYTFAINNNGIIVFHPRLKTVFGYLPDPPGVDLMDIELPVNSSQLLKLREEMIMRTPASVDPVSGEGQAKLEIFDLSHDELRVIKRNVSFYYAGFNGTSFSFAIATPKLGFQYNRGSHSVNSILGNLSSLLNASINIEKWPYCKSVTFAENPAAKLKAIKSEENSGDCNKDMLYGLLVDLRATSGMNEEWNKGNANVQDIFALTYWGLTKTKKSAGRPEEFSFQEIYGRVAASEDDTVTYVAPYVSAKADEKEEPLLFAFQKISLKGHPVAIVGYEMDVEKFLDELFVSKTKSSEQDLGGCSRSGKHSHEGLYCYLLDENGFVVAANHNMSSGKFFGRVDKYVMKELINGTARNQSTAIYNRIVFSDTQAACAERSSDNAGTIISGPLFSVRSYFEWWTTKATWSLLYFNLYSFLFSDTSSYTEATENTAKNRSCVKGVTAYYVDRGSVNEIGTAGCEETCTRKFVVSSVVQSNLHLIVVEAGCGQCTDGDLSLKMAGEPIKITGISSDSNCQASKFRRRPKRCFKSVEKEEDFDCGAGSTFTPSLLVVFVHVLCVALVTCILHPR